MESNSDTSIVTMDTAQYDKLVALARIGANEMSCQVELKGICRHVSKFNKHVTNESLDEQRAELLQRRENAALVRQLLSKYAGRETVVWAAGRWYSPHPGERDLNLLFPVRILGRDATTRNAQYKMVAVKAVDPAPALLHRQFRYWGEFISLVPLNRGSMMNPVRQLVKLTVSVLHIIETLPANAVLAKRLGPAFQGMYFYYPDNETLGDIA
jgi:hypothetical protein